MAKVKHRVSNLALTRDGNTMKATWRVPSAMTNPDYSDHATWIDSQFYFNVSGTVPKGRPTKGEVGMSNSTSDSSKITYPGYDYVRVRGQGVEPDVDKNYSRSRWHPIAKGTYCKQVKVVVWGGNDTKNSDGPKVEATYKFEAPRKPKATWTFASGNLTLKVETNAGTDNKERYNTMIRVTVKARGGTKYVALDTNLKGWFATTATTWTKTWDVSSYLSGLTTKDSVSFKCEAYAQGMAGNSETVEATRIVALPRAATIGAITADRKGTGGRIKVAVATNDVFDKLKDNLTEVQLYRRHGTDASTVEVVAGAADDGQCTALYDNWTNAAPNSGQYLYYAVKSTRDGYETWSAWKRADDLYTAATKPTCDAKVAITAMRPWVNGTTATVVMAWTDGKTASTGCELSYSSYGKAWSSSDESIMTRVEYTGSDSTKDASAANYKNSRAVQITGLTSGTTYYVRMRRYRTVSGVKRYTAYTAIQSFTAESASGDACGFIGIEPGADGTTAKLVIGMAADGNTGTEVTWSDHSDAWWSNEQPEKLEATWSATYSGSGYAKYQNVYLRGLQPGTKYSVRARRYLVSGGTTTYGTYSNDSFTTPTMADTLDLRCGIVSVTAGSDGRSAAVVVGWSGDRDGCEVSWSNDPNAWESSEQPQSAEFEWQDSWNKSGFKTADTSITSGKNYYTRSGSGTDASPYVYTRVQSPVVANIGTYYEIAWSATGTFYIAGLDEGATCYVRARTYADSGGGKAYSPYTEQSDVTPYAAPDSVVLTAPEAVARGEAIELWWTLQSDMEQREWHVHESGSANKSLAEGEGSLCRATVPPERYGSASSIEVYVEAGCGGGLAESNHATVMIADAPPCEVEGASTLTAQPMEFTVNTDETAARLLCTCRSRGVTLDAPDGARDQLDGDVVWTAAITPALEEHETDEGVYVASMTMPKCDLYDGGSYVLQVAAVEPVAGLKSEIAELPFTVAYGHQAQQPSATLAVDAAGRSVTVMLEEPYGYVQTEDEEVDSSKTYYTLAPWIEGYEGPEYVEVEEPSAALLSTYFEYASTAADGDVYDVYRKTPTGYELAAANVDMESYVVDDFAPFGPDGLAYAVCYRTADGDIAYDEFSYSLPVRTLRFDWDGGSVELPFNIDLRDRYGKSFETRAHADGSVSGYYDRAVEMTGSYSSATLRVEDPTAVASLRALADFPGAAFCRTPEGDAFQCNCDVSEVGGKVDGFAEVSLDVTRMALTEAFHATVVHKPDEEAQDG